jgi:hypothetical protein
MFKKILVAKRGDKGRWALAAQPNCMAREARAGDLDPMELTNV